MAVYTAQTAKLSARRNMSSTRIGSPEWVLDTNRLVAQKQLQTGTGFSDYELTGIRGDGAYATEDLTAGALGFNEEHFGLLEPQAVSCRACGALFIHRLWVMRRHRLQCGWDLS